MNPVKISPVGQLENFALDFCCVETNNVLKIFQNVFSKADLVKSERKRYTI